MPNDEYDAYRGDAFYEAWCRGHNPDRLDTDRLHDQFYDGLSVEEAVSRQFKRPEPEPEPYDDQGEE